MGDAVWPIFKSVFIGLDRAAWWPSVTEWALKHDTLSRGAWRSALRSAAAGREGSARHRWVLPGLHASMRTLRSTNQ